MQVTGLGFWDEGANGLGTNHTVGLWNSSSPSVLLASTVVNNSSTAVSSTSPDGDWLFNNITPLTLQPGTYVVGATLIAGDPDLLRQQTLSITDPSVTFDQAMDVGNPSLLYPLPAPAFNDGLFGPNLQISDVPEPGTFALLGLGAVGLLIARSHNSASGRTKRQLQKGQNQQVPPKT
jgi:hypothetical protein